MHAHNTLQLAHPNLRDAAAGVVLRGHFSSFCICPAVGDGGGARHGTLGPGLRQHAAHVRPQEPQVSSSQGWHPHFQPAHSTEAGLEDPLKSLTVPGPGEGWERGGGKGDAFRMAGLAPMLVWPLLYTVRTMFKRN